MRSQSFTAACETTNEGPGRGGDWRNVSAEAYYYSISLPAWRYDGEFPQNSVEGWVKEVPVHVVIKLGHVQNFKPFLQNNSTTSFLSDAGKQILLPQQDNIEKRETHTAIFSRRQTIRNWMSAVRLEQETSISAAHYWNINFAWGIEKRKDVPEPDSDFFLKAA